MSAVYGCLLIYFLQQSISLLVQLQDAFQNNKIEAGIPGQSSLIAIIVLISVSIFLRMIFISYEDVGKLAKIESMNSGTNEWQIVLTIEMATEIFNALSVFAALYLIYRVESAVALCQVYTPVEKQD